VAISQGKGWLETRGGARTLVAGSVFLLPPGYWHRYRPDPATGWTEDWLELRGPTLDAWLAKGLLDVGALTMSRSSPFWARFGELHGVCLKRPLGYRAIAAGIAMTLLASVVSENAAGAKKSQLPELARRARELLMEGREVGSVARTLGVSYPTLYRNFKQATGLGPKDYARQIRLARAEELLAGTSMSVKEIAARLGYYSASHLSLEFKHARGIAPSLWPGRGHMPEKWLD
jgi:AraC-like DNA-binding protein